MQTNEGWKAHHFVSEYRCLLRDELSTALRKRLPRDSVADASESAFISRLCWR